MLGKIKNTQTKSGMMGFCQQTDKRRRSTQSRIIRRARGHNARMPAEMFRMGSIYLGLVALQIAFFIHYQGMSWWLVLAAFPFGALLGFGLFSFHWKIKGLRRLLYSRMGKVLSGFLLFFIYLLGYILIFSVAVSLPVGWFFEYFSGRIGVSVDFELYSINFIMLVSLLSWLDWLRRTTFSKTAEV